MTTIVTVSTGEHPARVVGYPFVDHQPVDDGQSRLIADVPANSTLEFAAHGGEAIGVIELAVEACDALAEVEENDLAQEAEQEIEEAA